MILQCDASDHGLGTALIQKWRPVAFACRALTNAEKNYAQVEKELLAIVYGTERFYHFTYGRSVIESDHKPLEVIHQKPLSAAPRHLQKLLMRLQHYDSTIQYKKGAEMFLADALSRHHLASTTSTNRDENQAYQLPDAYQLSSRNQLTPSKRSNTQPTQRRNQRRPFTAGSKKIHLIRMACKPKDAGPNDKTVFARQRQTGSPRCPRIPKRPISYPKDVEKADIARATLSPSMNSIQHTESQRDNLLATHKPGT